MAQYLPYAMTVIGALIALTNLTVEVIKKAVPSEKLPTNILAVIIAEAFTLVGFFAFCGVKGITPLWYYIVGAVVLGILISYGAMFGYDKLKEIIDKLNPSKD